MHKESVIGKSNKEFINQATENGAKSIHFIGLGGIGMSALAKFLLELGYKVSGSDIKDGSNLFSISELGGTVFIGHSSKNIGEAALLVVSTAIKEDNPELMEAKKFNIPIMHRSQILEALMSGLGLEAPEKQVAIGVSGTHGKTTTSGMVSHIFELADMKPSIAVGGKLPVLKTNSKLGEGKYFISELDESDGSIAIYTPNMTVVTNLEVDHIDHYADGMKQLLDTFINFTSKLPEHSKLVMNSDCPGNMSLYEKIDQAKVILYSCDETSENFDKADYIAKDVEIDGFYSSAKIYKKDQYLGKLELKVPGIHNVSNALAALVVSLENGISFEKATEALAKFSGMKRRFQVLKKVKDIQVVDDYAHHPTEVIATLRSAKAIVDANCAKRVVAVFQPHRYSRLAGLWDDFAKSFKDSDLLYVCDVYSAGEKPVENYGAEEFSKSVLHDNVKYAPGSLNEIAEIICPDLQPGDIVLTLGAGNITSLGTLIIEKV